MGVGDPGSCGRRKHAEDEEYVKWKTKRRGDAEDVKTKRQVDVAAGGRQLTVKNPSGAQDAKDPQAACREAVDSDEGRRRAVHPLNVEPKPEEDNKQLSGAQGCEGTARGRGTTQWSTDRNGNTTSMWCA